MGLEVSRKMGPEVCRKMGPGCRPILLTAADMKITKLHVENVQVRIEKSRNNTCVVQTHVDLKNKMDRFFITHRTIAIRLIDGCFKTKR